MSMILSHIIYNNNTKSELCWIETGFQSQCHFQFYLSAATMTDKNKKEKSHCMVQKRPFLLYTTWQSFETSQVNKTVQQTANFFHLKMCQLFPLTLPGSHEQDYAVHEFIKQLLQNLQQIRQKCTADVYALQFHPSVS